MNDHPIEQTTDLLPPLSAVVPPELGIALIVDDDDFQRDLLGSQLMHLGWSQLKFAESGQAALAVYDQYQQKIELIVCDLSMPDMDGLVLMRHFAQRKVEAGIFLVSGASEEIRSSAAGLASAHGLNLVGVLPKACTLDDLRIVIAALQSKKQRKNFRGATDLPEARLRAALADAEFVPWYQPKVMANSKACVGVEALARWMLPTGGMIGPADFIPAIEGAGLADALFYAIVKQTVSDLIRWNQQGLDIKVAINMSMDTALNLDMPEQLSAMVLKAGLHPAQFVIEVTESRLMVERSIAMETLTRLSLMGFVLAIDDFGTGFSSLVQLIDLPFKELKIDGSFVRRADQELKARTVARIACLLGNNLQMNVVAEGVETLDQLEFVQKCGCDMVQGYYFAKPMAFDACTKWLTQNSAISK